VAEGGLSGPPSSQSIVGSRRLRRRASSDDLQLLTVKTPQPCGTFSRPQRRAAELHDSKVLSVTDDDGTVRALLSAYVHVSTGEPGRDAGTGWSQDIELVLTCAAVESRPAELPMWITDGSLSVGTARAVLLPLPLDTAGDVRLVLIGSEGTLTVRAAAVVAVPKGEAIFIERVPRVES
jgi:hypothetical protein